MSALGIDIAKLVFHVVGMDDTGQVILGARQPIVLTLKIA
jgi:hypothetical protein